MFNNIKNKICKLPKTILYSISILIIWEVILIIQKSSWINLVFVLSGAITGYLIMEIDWLFPKKEIKRLLPLILSPVTLFILTSTNGLLGKSTVIFLNLRLILDRLK